MPTYETLITNVGAAKIANSQTLGAALAWSHIAVGDGSGSAVAVLPTRTALVHEVHRGAINHLYRDPDDDTQVVAELVILPETGGWTIREVGIFDSAGDLVVYGSLPEVVKPVLASGSGVTLTVVCRAAVGSSANVTLMIDPSYVLATRKWSTEQLNAHKAATDAHPAATTSVPGFATLATQAEVNAGKSSAKTVTPATLMTILNAYAITGADGTILDGGTPAQCDAGTYQTILDGGTPSQISA